MGNYDYRRGREMADRVEFHLVLSGLRGRVADAIKEVLAALERGPPLRRTRTD